MNSGYQKIIKYIIGFALIAFVGISLVKDYDAARAKTVGINLTRLEPNLEFMVKLRQFHNPFSTAQTFHGLRDDDRKELARAVKYYEKVIATLPANADAYGLLAFCYVHAGQYERAIETYLKARHLNPQFFWYSYNLGVLHFRLQRFELAVNYLSEALTKSVDSTLMSIQSSQYLYIPLVSRQVDSFRELEGQMQRAIASSYKLIVIAEQHLERYSEMMLVALQALKSQRGSEGFFYYYAGLAAVGLQQYERGIDLLEKSIVADKRRASAYYYLGTAYKNSGDVQKAFTALEIAGKLAVEVHGQEQDDALFLEELAPEMY